MNEEFIYTMLVRNIHTNEHCYKVGYTSSIIERLEQLQKRNVHFEYSNIKLYKHASKSMGYIHDEQRIHTANKNYRKIISREAMKEGFTECYELYSYGSIYNQLTKLGYTCIYDEVETMKPKVTPMFVWQ